MSDPFSGEIPRSLSDLKEIGCKSAWAVHISPLYWSIEQLLTCKIGKICPRPAEFSPRFFKSDRLLGDFGKAADVGRLCQQRAGLRVCRLDVSGRHVHPDRRVVLPLFDRHEFSGRVPALENLVDDAARL